MAKVKYIYWRYHRKYVEEEDSITDALSRAEYDADSGQAAVESIITEKGLVIAPETIWQWRANHAQAEKFGTRKERERLMALRQVTTRPIAWKEASRIIRRMRWKPVIARERGVAVLVANKWGKMQRIASFAMLRRMTPAQFWQRLRSLDPYRIAEVERNIF